MDIKLKKKNIVQDVVPPRRSIRNVELPSKHDRTISDVIVVKEDTSGKRKITIQKEEKPPQKEIKPTLDNYAFEYEEPPRSSKKILYSAVFILVLALAFGASAFFKGATIKVTPKNQTVAFEESFSAKKDNNGGGLVYQTVVLSKDIEKTVPATTDQKVSKKATGKIAILNNYSSQPQNLLINTRFETPEGLIFRSTKAVTIPGNKINPGRVEVEIVADQPGDKYNVEFKDFTIVGFKGDPRYTKITAKSTSPISGGFEGTQKAVSEEVIVKVDSDLESSVKDYLSKEISSQIPANFVLYPNSITYTYAPLVQSASGDAQSALFRKKGTATAIIFDKGSLSRIIISKVLPSVADDLVKISNLDSFVFTYSKDSSFDPESSTYLDFTLKGDAKFEWVFDENKLKSELLGLQKDKALVVISTYKSINEAWVETRPFWNKTIPSDSKKVKLINTLSQ